MLGRPDRFDGDYPALDGDLDPCFFSRNVFSMLILLGVAFSMLERMMVDVGQHANGQPVLDDSGPSLSPYRNRTLDASSTSISGETVIVPTLMMSRTRTLGRSMALKISLEVTNPMIRSHPRPREDRGTRY